tara:strand:- start:441 stop:869 length:429 start_codon:yes stop_codon:yes gene_type:complete
MQKLPAQTKGFTLVEIMVASVILFTAITLLTFVYRTAVLSSGKAANNVKITSTVTMVMSNIQSHIRGANALKPLSGSGRIDGVEYHWQSSLLKQAPAPKRFDPDEGKWVAGVVRYYFWQVNLSLTYGSLVKDYHYNEVSWKS